MKDEQSFRLVIKESSQSDMVEWFGSGKNDWYCWLQDPIVVTVYLLGYLCWPHRNSPTSSWAGGASSPQYTAAYQPDAASTHSPPPPLLTPHHHPPQTNSYLPSNFSVPFKSAPLGLSVHLLLTLQWSGFPLQSHSKGL